MCRIEIRFFLLFLIECMSIKVYRKWSFICMRAWIGIDGEEGRMFLNRKNGKKSNKEIL